MHFRTRALLAIVGGATATQAISLSNFTPRVNNLPTACQTVYTTSISGCQTSDFTASHGRCSSSCVQGLLQISQQVQSACKNANVDSNSIIGVFLAGNGIPSLCPDVAVTTIAPSSTQSSAQSQTPAAQISSSSQDASPASSSSTDDAASSTETSAPTTLVTSAANTPAPTDNAPQASSSSSSSSTSSAKPKSTSSNQKSNSASGGGSPFDVQATGASATVRSLATGTLLGLVALIFASL